MKQYSATLQFAAKLLAVAAERVGIDNVTPRLTPCVRSRAGDEGRDTKLIQDYLASYAS